MEIFNNLIDFLESHKYFKNSLYDYTIAFFIFIAKELKIFIIGQYFLY